MGERFVRTPYERRTNEDGTADRNDRTGCGSRAAEREFG